MKQFLLLSLFTVLFVTNAIGQKLTITELGRYTDGQKDACEISAYDASTTQLIITNAASNVIDLVDVSDFANPIFVKNIPVAPYGGGVNSLVNLGNGYFAVAIEAPVKQDSGKVVFFDMSANYVAEVKVGALPDMLAVTKNGQKLLVACEGEPNDTYTVDPEGSIAIIDLSGSLANITATQVTFLGFSNAPSSISGGAFKPNTNLANDLEPEYIAINDNSTEAVVVCQESNVFVLLDLVADTIKAYKGLGYKDHSLVGNGLDASDKDGVINIATHPVKGVYQPDAIASYTVNGATFYASANEGDARDYGGYSSETRIMNLVLDPVAFPSAAALQSDSVLGRLKTFTADVLGDTDGDGDVDELYSYGARSFSIWDENGQLVWDSGDEIAQYIANNHPSFFNCNSGKASKMDSRSDDKGAEPEALTIGQIGGHSYAFIGLERQGGIMVYDITDPTAPVFEQYIHTFDTATGTSIDIAPEGLGFVPASASHNQQNLLIVSSEVSGTTTIYQLEDKHIGTTILETQDIRLYPNPTTGILNLELPEITKPLQYKLYNALGQVVLQGELEEQREQVSLEQLPNGCYFLTVGHVKQTAVSYRVMKQ